MCGLLIVLSLMPSYMLLRLADTEVPSRLTGEATRLHRAQLAARLALVSASILLTLQVSGG